MAKVYLSMKTPEAALVRVLSFERGKPIAEFSVGRRGTWHTSGLAIADRHLWVSFDGECVVLRRDSAGDPVRVNGRPLQLSPERLVRLPCRVEFGGALLVVDDRKPPVAALDAGVLRRAEPTILDTEASSSELLFTQMFDIRMFSDLEAKWGTSGRADFNVSKPKAKERMVADGCATSVMPLEDLLRRGFAEGHADDRRSERRRRRRLRRSGRRELVAGVGWQSRLRRWLKMLRDEHVVASRRKRVLALALLVPGLTLLSNGLLSGASGATPGGGLFDPTAAAPMADERMAREAAARAPVSATNDGAVSDSESPMPGEPSSDPVAELGGEEAAVVHAPPLESRTASQHADDALSVPTIERQAIDALAASDKVRARALYALLVRRAPENVAFAEAARILGVGLNGYGAAVSGLGSNVLEKGLADGLARPPR